MEEKRLYPDYVFESSWEVCNKVGGIYTVLSSRAKTLVKKFKDQLLFIGPDCYKENDTPFFEEDKILFADWRCSCLEKGLKIRVGRWKIPGNPVAVLVDFSMYYKDKNDIYAQLWLDFHVDSLHAYGDYDEASMFSYAAAKVVESYYLFYSLNTKQVVYHANEWMLGLGALYLKKNLPEIATIFTTHATSIGRSIAGNNKPLYEYLVNYNGDQMADELNMQSKHSIEKQTAWNVDCFTTVSDITARECKELLDRSVDVVLPNGFENEFVPKGCQYKIKRENARRRMLDVANALLGTNLSDDTLIISTSGRYEFRNKGIDVFIEALNKLRLDTKLERNVVAFIEVPGWISGPRHDLSLRLTNMVNAETNPLCYPYLTHWLHEMEHDNVLSMLRNLNFVNSEKDKVKIIFVPCYLNGDDGIFNMSYYDMILGNDLCIFPSYYEPWGYTPLEAIAFEVPCITTDLSGFGLWVNSEVKTNSTIDKGVEVVHRTDYNYMELSERIKKIILEYSQKDLADIIKSRKNAGALSKKALWDKFIVYYYKAYDIALKNKNIRLSNK